MDAVPVRGDEDYDAPNTASPPCVHDEPLTSYSRWEEIPLDVLRGFVRELRELHTDRGVARLTGQSTASVQDFALGRTNPRERTIRLFADLYLAYHKSKRLRESLPPLASIIPGGPEGALRIIDILVRAGRETHRIPAGVLDGLGSWLRRLILAEYDDPQPPLARDQPDTLRRRRNRVADPRTDPA